MQSCGFGGRPGAGSADDEIPVNIHFSKQVNTRQCVAYFYCTVPGTGSIQQRTRESQCPASQNKKCRRTRLTIPIPGTTVLYVLYRIRCGAHNTALITRCCTVPPSTVCTEQYKTVRIEFGKIIKVPYWSVLPLKTVNAILRVYVKHLSTSWR